MATQKNQTPPSSGAPQWTYIVGAIGVIGTLIWAIASHFIPKAETPPAKPVAPASAPAAPAPAISVSGSGNATVVGSMTGGSISVNAPAAPASAGR